MQHKSASNMYFGCPMWSHPKWAGSLFPSSQTHSPALASYQTIFNSVEGNTSFYQLPSEQKVDEWRQQVDKTFSFTFKFPREISHNQNLNHCAENLSLALNRFEKFEQQLGCLMLQLPSGFSPRRFSELALFLSALPRHLNYAVEVRHMDWFDKGDNEQRLNQLLHQHNIDRVIMDTRGLFACHQPTDTLTLEVQAKKPRVPTHVVNTGTNPIVRFVGHPNVGQNDQFLAPWVTKVSEWLKNGITPYFFFHMPDNALAPWLAQRFFTLLHNEHPNLPLPNIPNQHQQLDIF